MGVKERHEREREAVARAILDAARDLFVAEGYQHVDGAIRMGRHTAARIMEVARVAVPAGA